ncbi:glycosyltransferase family 4 protein [Candidatus Dependentiae bacterium]|nr:glycosyltransferase family 4 protein [Candidatus Dependentiae bacterium]
MGKKRILIFGTSPLPEENPDRLTCPEIRTGIFVNYLKHDFEICLIAIREFPMIENGEIIDKFYTEEFGFKYYSLNKIHFRKHEMVRKIARDFNPDVILGINSFPSFYAATLGIDVPVWVDLNGSMMMEGQLKAYKENIPDLTSKFWKIEKAILQRADKFSVVSRPQKFELIGELGGIGRLNKLNSGYEFIEIIPEPVLDYIKPVFRRENLDLFKPDDFVIFWMGGFNYWTDVDFLFKVLERAMIKNPKIKFLSIGGNIFGQKTQKQEKLITLINQSSFKDNFKIIGWVKTDEVEKYVLACNFGINIDNNSYETLIGARYRIIEMLRLGLPILSTKGSEITEIVNKQGLGLVSPIGDTERFVENILTASKLNREEYKKLSSKCKDFVNQQFSPKVLLKPLKTWINNPACSPDHNQVANYNRTKAVIKKLHTFFKLIYHPADFFRILKRKLAAFLNG